MSHDFWFDSNMADGGVTPPRPTRDRHWSAPKDFPGHDLPWERGEDD